MEITIGFPQFNNQIDNSSLYHYMVIVLSTILMEIALFPTIIIVITIIMNSIIAILKIKSIIIHLGILIEG